MSVWCHETVPGLQKYWSAESEGFPGHLLSANLGTRGNETQVAGIRSGWAAAEYQCCDEHSWRTYSTVYLLSEHL